MSVQLFWSLVTMLPFLFDSSEAGYALAANNTDVFAKQIQSIGNRTSLAMNDYQWSFEGECTSTSDISAGSQYKCCANTNVGRWEYNVRVPSSSDDNMQVDILPATSHSTGRSSSKCRIYDNNRECDGDPCKWFPSSTKYDCERSATYNTISSYDNKSCIRVKCTNSWSDCDIYSISAKFYIRGSYIGSSSSPPPPPPSPPPPSSITCAWNADSCGSKCSETTGSSDKLWSGGSCTCLANGYPGSPLVCSNSGSGSGNAPSPPPPQASCPTSSSECTSFCSGKGYTNGASWSYSSSSGGSCRCFTSSGNLVTPSCTSYSPPPPPSPPPPSPPSLGSNTPTSSSTGDCECTCCKGSYCSASSVGFFNAGSSSSCSATACRAQFPSSCPASGSSGSAISSYSSSSDSSSTNLFRPSSPATTLTGLLGLISASVVAFVLV